MNSLAETDFKALLYHGLKPVGTSDQTGALDNCFSVAGKGFDLAKANNVD